MNQNSASPRGKSRFVDFKALKQQVSIVQILEHYALLGELSERGEQLIGCCPICDGESSSQFKVSPNKNAFKCFSCDAGGNQLDLVRYLEDCSVRSAALKIAEWFGIEKSSPSKAKSPGRSPKRPQKRSSRESSQSESPPERVHESVNAPIEFELDLDSDHPWLVEIGLEPETVEEFGLGYCSKGTMKGCIAFPVHDVDGNLVAYVGRNPSLDDESGKEPLWRYPGAKYFQPSLEVFNLHRALTKREGEGLVIGSDPLEVVQLWQNGEHNVVCFLDRDVPVSVLKRIAAI